MLLAALDMALLALRLLGPEALNEGPWRALMRAAGAAITLGLLGVVLLLARQLRRNTAKLAHLVDALSTGVSLWDADDRLVLTNAEMRRLYAPLAPMLQPGLRFEDMMRAALAHGLVPEAEGRHEAWLAERMQAHRAGAGVVSALRQLPPGQWRRVIEQRLPDGGLLGHSVDVTDLVRQEQALQAAHDRAELAHRRLQDALEALPAGFELYDAEDRLVLTNHVMAEMYPRVADLLDSRPTFEQLVRTNFERGGLPHLAGPGQLDAWLQERLRGRAQPSGPRVHEVADGRRLRVYERRTREGGIVAVRIDVTELQRQQAAAENATQRLQDAIDVLPDAFALYDADDRLVVFNQRYREVYHESAAVMAPGIRFEDALRHGLAVGQYPQAVGREEAWLAERMQAHRQPQGPLLQELPGNRWMRIFERATRDGGRAGVRVEVTELVRREQQLRALNGQLDTLNTELAHLSDTDALTGLANRRQFDRRLAEEWRRARRHGTPLALLLFDIDHFKRYNDRYGHLAGDECLRQVARLLQEAARRPADLVARLGGEEFAMLLPQQDPASAAAQAQRCLAALQAAAIEHGDSPVGPHLTLSIGGAHTQAQDDAAAAEAVTLVAAADAALYAAKQAGRNRVRMAAPP